MENSLYWQLRSKDRNEPSLIFGTLHLSHPAAIQHMSMLQSLLDSYHIVFTESSLDKMHSADLAAVAGLDRSVWKEYLTDSQIQKMSRATRKYLSFELESMMELRPLLIWSFMCKILLDAHDDSLDQAIWDYAIKNAKNLNCIESIEEQMDIMNSIPLRFEFHQLRDSLLHISKTNRNLKTLIQYYEKQDISELYKKTKSSLGPNKALLLTDRNRKFADRIWRAHENEASFFCFGAAHLAGKNGVLNELKRKGAKIKELKILNL